jgi:hypothetical protein
MRLAIILAGFLKRSFFAQTCGIERQEKTDDCEKSSVLIPEKQTIFRYWQAVTYKQMVGCNRLGLGDFAFIGRSPFMIFGLRKAGYKRMRS